MQSEGLTQPQFAAALGVSPTTVKRALARAVRDAGRDALAIDGVVGGHGFSAQRRVARGGEPWRFALAGGSSAAADDGEPSIAPAASLATPGKASARKSSTQAATSRAADEQIVWLRAEIERGNAALEREQLANIELRRLLLGGGSASHPASVAAPDVSADHALIAAVERAAHEVGVGKKQRRDLLARLAALLEHDG